MRRATPIVAVMALLGLASCGSGDDDDAASASSSTGASMTSSASVSTVATATAAGEVVTTPAPLPPPPPPSATTAPAEVGAVLLGTAVASPETRDLVVKWGYLHAVRTALGGLAVLCFLWGLSAQ